MNTVRVADKRYPLSLPWNDGATEANMELRPLQIFDPVTRPVPISLTKSRHSPTQQTLHYNTMSVCTRADWKGRKTYFHKIHVLPHKLFSLYLNTHFLYSKEQKHVKKSMFEVDCSNSEVSPLAIFLIKTSHISS
jgi:hypothetical protein